MKECQTLYLVQAYLSFPEKGTSCYSGHIFGHQNVQHRWVYCTYLNLNQPFLDTPVHMCSSHDQSFNTHQSVECTGLPVIFLSNLSSFVFVSDIFFLCLYQRTPLHVAAENGHLEIVKHLFVHGADISAKDVDGVSTYVHHRNLLTRRPPFL